jgi:hypothetical protein
MAASESQITESPLLKSYQALPPNEELFSKDVKFWKATCKALAKEVCKIAKDKLDLSIIEPPSLPYPLPDDAKWLPIIWCRTFVSTSLLDTKSFQMIKDFSSGPTGDSASIWEIGAGSGYNARILELMGVDVYPMDKASCRFVHKFTTVHYLPNGMESKRLKEIIDKGGAVMYIWPEYDYHYLDMWIRLGGKKVITCGVYDPDHMDIYRGANPNDAPPTCPLFPPKQYKNRFELVSEHKPPPYHPEDSSTADTLHL